jgi:signal transduction histidine kinase
LSSLLLPHLNKPDAQQVETLIAGVDNPIKEVANGLAIYHSPYVRIRFIASDGRELFITQGLKKDFNLGSALDESIFLQAVSVSGQFPPLKREHDSLWVTTFSIPLNYAKGATPWGYDVALLGFIFLDLDMASLSKILREMAATRPGYYFLFDGSGSIIAEGGTSLISAGDPNYEHYQSALRQVRDDPKPNFSHHAFDAGEQRFFIGSQPVKEYIAFKEPIPQERWYLSVVNTETPLLSAFRQSQMLFFVVLAFGIVLSIAGTFYISKKITTPIRQLTNAAQKFAHGNLESSIEVMSRDEVGQLAADFNDMAADIRQFIRERQANETLIAIGRFSATLAHDLRNPVEGLKLLSRELCKRVGADRPEYEIADTIAQSVERLSSLVNQSLDFARLTKPVFAATDLTALSDEVLKDFRFDTIQLNKDYAADLPLVEVDAGQIKRVIANLIKNALEACMSKATVTENQISLTLKPVSEKVRIEIADTGLGIPPEVREKMFEPFFSTKPAGHGLGLSFARQIIANHGGTITFTSTVGQGTRFVIELPISQTLSDNR